MPNKHKVFLVLLGWLIAVFLPPQMLFSKVRSRTA
jgi:hypothetical protein